MFVVMIAPECAPVAKVGGLGDVVYGLSRELEIRGNAVEIILPKYDCLRVEHIWGLQPTWHDLRVPWFGGHIPCTVWFGFVDGRKCFFVEPHSPDRYFERGTFYGCGDDHLRFAFFTRAALEFMRCSGKRPEIVHSHDWQTALTAPILFELYQHQGMSTQRVCHTVHNFRHQGTAGPEILWATGLGRPEHFLDRERLGDDWHPGVVNFTKGAIVFANFITTVSPHHAWEARFTDQGFGLGPALARHHDKFGGILNGLDYEVWNPETDPHLAARYSVETVERKAENTRALRHRLWLRESAGPLVAFVGRLDPQKGLHLVKHALDHSLRQGAQFVLLGSSPDRAIDEEFRFVKHVYNDNPDCHLEIGFDEGLAHLIYAAADLVVVPSLYEPCGLPQMIALRYGAVPIVRRVGGLANTVFDRDWSERPPEERNGWVFEHPDFPGIESAMDRAFALWRDDPRAFRAFARQGMRCDYSWRVPGEHYLRVYEHIRHK